MSSAGWLLDWPAAASTDASVCGGKGWNLGRLHRYGFLVPAGGVLVAEAYRTFMDAAGLKRQIAEAGESEEKLAFLRTSIEASPVQEEVAAAVRAYLEATGLSKVKLAVRSSATAEDSAQASFAGIHRSYLNVEGADEVLRAIRGCWASLWTPQAVSYRRKMMIDAPGCAVVICAMVAAESAGVAFSCDPKNGRRDVTAISAVRGLAEGLVGGAVNPEETRVVLGEKGLQVEPRPEGRKVLTETQALELARQVLRVHWAFGDGQDPQDVEWVYDGRRWWIVQARPVTRVPRVTPAGTENLPAIWSNANIKDAVPFVMTSMTWGLVQSALRQMMWYFPEMTGYSVPPGLEVTRRFSGRGYFDLTGAQWIFYDAFGSPPAETNRAMGGHQPEIPVPDKLPFRGPKGRERLRRTWRAFRLLLRSPKILRAEMDVVFEQARFLKSLDYESMTPVWLLAMLTRLSLLQIRFSKTFMLASSGLVWLSQLEILLKKLSPERGPALAAALVSGTGQVSSAEHGYRLYELGQLAKQDEAVKAWLEAKPFEPHGWRALAPESGFRVEMEKFMKEYGHRAVYEAEAANPRWNEDPTYLFEQVRHFMNVETPPQAQALRRRKEAEAEVRRLTFFRRPQIRWLADKARTCGALREASKSALVAQIEPLRRILLEVGKRLQESGKLGAAEDVFHLAFIDVELYLRGGWDGSGARELAEDRKAQRRKWMTQSPPDVVIEGGTAKAAMPEKQTSVARGPVMTGVGVAAGVAQGPARVIRHPSEGSRLQQGDVLVAPSTDPAWTPLFLRASAVVMEVGGIMSHGAIVAREYGLPAVVNIPGLLAAVKDGQMLEVNGDTGVVKKVEVAAPVEAKA